MSLLTLQNESAFFGSDQVVENVTTHKSKLITVIDNWHLIKVSLN
jgi:hypothetical protein